MAHMHFVMSDELKEWVESQSKSFGMSQSAFINFCISQYKQQSEAMRVMQNLNPLVEKLQELQKNINELKQDK